MDPAITCKELTTEEMETLVKKAAEPAAIAKMAGFGGAEIHTVHEGYLLDLFTIAMFNRRTDKHRGDLMGEICIPHRDRESNKEGEWKRFSCNLRFSIKSYIKGNVVRLLE